MFEKLPLYISSVALLVMIVYSIVTDRSLSEMALLLIIVIVVFYIVGIIIRRYLLKYIFIPEETEPELEEGQNDEDGAEETDAIEEIGETEDFDDILNEDDEF